MIHSQASISLFDLPLFTWIDLTTPMHTALAIPSEACFTYIISGDGHQLSQLVPLVANADQAILSACGMTMGKMIAEQDRGRMTTLIVHFHPTVLKMVYQQTKPKYWKEIEKPISNPVVLLATTNLIKQYVEGIKTLFLNRAAITDDILILKLKEIILLLFQTRNSPQVSHIMSSLFSEREFSFKEIVEGYLFAPVSISDLANLTHTSLSTFKREFKKIYDTTPASYILERRVQKVAETLISSDDPIHSIGYDCGFATPSHLTRVFKSKYGQTPSAYRKAKLAISH